jgi:hypothetical protein
MDYNNNIPDIYNIKNYDKQNLYNNSDDIIIRINHKKDDKYVYIEFEKNHNIITKKYICDKCFSTLGDLFSLEQIYNIDINDYIITILNSNIFFIGMCDDLLDKGVYNILGSHKYKQIGFYQLYDINLKIILQRNKIYFLTNKDVFHTIIFFSYNIDNFRFRDWIISHIIKITLIIDKKNIKDKIKDKIKYKNILLKKSSCEYYFDNYHHFYNVIFLSDDVLNFSNMCDFFKDLMNLYNMKIRMMFQFSDNK